MMGLFRCRQFPSVQVPQACDCIPDKSLVRQADGDAQPILPVTFVVFTNYDLKIHETDEKYTIVRNNIVYHRMLFDGTPGFRYFNLNLNNINKETD